MSIHNKMPKGKISLAHFLTFSKQDVWITTNRSSWWFLEAKKTVDPSKWRDAKLDHRPLWDYLPSRCFYFFVNFKQDHLIPTTKNQITELPTKHPRTEQQNHLNRLTKSNPYSYNILFSATNHTLMENPFKNAQIYTTYPVKTHPPFHPYDYVRIHNLYLKITHTKTHIIKKKIKLKLTKTPFPNNNLRPIKNTKCYTNNKNYVIKKPNNPLPSTHPYFDKNLTYVIKKTNKLKYKKMFYHINNTNNFKINQKSIFYFYLEEKNNLFLMSAGKRIHESLDSDKMILEDSSNKKAALSTTSTPNHADNLSTPRSNISTNSNEPNTANAINATITANTSPSNTDTNAGPDRRNHHPTPRPASQYPANGNRSNDRDDPNNSNTNNNTQTTTKQEKMEKIRRNKINHLRRKIEQIEEEIAASNFANASFRREFLRIKEDEKSRHTKDIDILNSNLPAWLFNDGEEEQEETGVFVVKIPGDLSGYDWVGQFNVNFPEFPIDEESIDFDEIGEEKFARCSLINQDLIETFKIAYAASNIYGTITWANQTSNSRYGAWVANKLKQTETFWRTLIRRIGIMEPTLIRLINEDEGVVVEWPSESAVKDFTRKLIYYKGSTLLYQRTNKITNIETLSHRLPRPPGRSTSYRRTFPPYPIREEHPQQEIRGTNQMQEAHPTKTNHQTLCSTWSANPSDTADQGRKQILGLRIHSLQLTKGCQKSVGSSEGCGCTTKHRLGSGVSSLFPHRICGKRITHPINNQTKSHKRSEVLLNNQLI